MKKAFVIGVIIVFIVLPFVSTASASTNFNKRSPEAFGAGTFIHEHQGIPHKHYFTFSVSEGILKRDGWFYRPDGKFFMTATHDQEIHMIAKSDYIQRMKLTKADEGLNVIFEGVATVKHMDTDWQRGWKFTVVASDTRHGDSINIMFTAPDGTEHHMMGIDTGNIVIKK